MSSDSNAALVSAYENDLLSNYAGCAAAVTIFYEHLTTLKYEADFLRSRRKSAATWILLSNRYLLIARVLYTIAPISPQVCHNSPAVDSLVFFVETMQDVPLHAFTIMRSVALLQTRSWKLITTGILGVLALVTFVVDTYENFVETWAYVDDPVLGSSCYPTGYSVSASLVQRLLIVGGICGIASAAIALLITLINTARQLRLVASLRLANTLSEVLLRDGSLFFLSILLEDILHSVPATNVIVTAGPIGLILNQTIPILPFILLSRFIINLRRAATPSSIPSDNRHPSRFSSPNFRMPTLDEVMDNLGEPMEFVEYRVDDDDDDDAKVQQDERTDAHTSIDAGVDVEQGNISGPSGTSRADVEGAGPSGSGMGSSSTDIGTSVSDYGIQEALRLSPV